MKANRCPHCNGKMFIDGKYVYCLNCDYYRQATKKDIKRIRLERLEIKQILLNV